MEKLSPFQAAIKPGVIIGLILVAITFISYFIDDTLLGATWLGLFTLALYSGLIIYFGNQYRSDLGGFMNFGTAYQFSLFSLFIMLLITTCGNMLLFLVLDSGLVEQMADVGLEKTLQIMDSFGAGDVSSEQMDGIRDGILEGYTAWGMIKGFGFMLIFYSILALILGAIIKKRDKALDY